MPSFKYIGYYDRLYGGIKAADGRDLFVRQGDVAEMDEPPNDGMWIPVEPDPEPVNEPAPKDNPKTQPAADIPSEEVN